MAGSALAAWAYTGTQVSRCSHSRARRASRHARAGPGRSQASGYLAGGIGTWDGELRSYPTATTGDLCDATARGDDLLVLDVRQKLEWAWGTIPGSRTLFVADLPRQLATIPRDRTCWVICSNGHRASIAASLVDAAGIPVRLIGAGSVTEYRRHCRQVPAASR